MLHFFVGNKKLSVWEVLQRETEADMIIIISLVDNQQISSHRFDRNYDSYMSERSELKQTLR